MALFSTFTDDFNDNVTGASWTKVVTASATITETGGQVVAVPSSSSSGSSAYYQSGTYSLVGNRAFIEVPGPLLNSMGTTFFRLSDSTATNVLSFEANDTSLQMMSIFSSGYDIQTITFNLTNHRWWRISNAGSQFYWETSPDGTSWVTQKTSSVPFNFPTSTLIASFGATMQAGNTKGYSATFDNYNNLTALRAAHGSASGGGTAILVSETASIALGGSASGGGRATVITVYQAIPQKEYEYHVSTHAGVFVAIWKDVTSPFNYSQALNQNATELNVTIARAPDNIATSYSVLTDETGATVTDDLSSPISVQTSTANAVGADTDVDLNYNVDVYAFYGGYENLLDDQSAVITDEIGDPILSQFGAPNGKRVYSGYIADYNLKFGSTNGVNVVVAPTATDQSHTIFKTSGGNTTVTYNSVDPVIMARDAVTNYRTQGGVISYTTETMPLSGNISSYDFNLQTTREAVDKTIDLLPSGYYHFVDPGENLHYLLQAASTAHHTFWYEKHISELDLRKTLTQLVNKVYFIGGEITPGVDLFKYYEDTTSISNYRSGLDRIADSRVTLDSSAAIISQSKIAELKDPKYRTSVKITDAVYDIESIKLGQMVAFKNFGTFVDQLLLQIVRLTREDHAVVLDLDMIVDSDTKRLQDIKRNLLSEQVRDVGVAPS